MSDGAQWLIGACLAGFVVFLIVAWIRGDKSQGDGHV